MWDVQVKHSLGYLKMRINTVQPEENKQGFTEQNNQPVSKIRLSVELKINIWIDVTEKIEMSTRLTLKS